MCVCLLRQLLRWSDNVFLVERVVLVFYSLVNPTHTHHNKILLWPTCFTNFDYFVPASAGGSIRYDVARQWPLRNIQNSVNCAFNNLRKRKKFKKVKKNFSWCYKIRKSSNVKDLGLITDILNWNLFKLPPLKRFINAFAIFSQLKLVQEYLLNEK